MIDKWFQIDIKTRFARDTKYIKENLIAKQWEDDSSAEEDEREKYINFSRILKAVTVFNMTKRQYRRYWINQYNDYPEYKEKILELIDEKFEFGLTSPEEMIKLVEESKDFESEKARAIKLLRKTKEKKEV